MGRLRGTSILGVAASAGALALVATSPAASAKPKPSPASKTSYQCSEEMTTQVPTGQTQVFPGSSGAQWGSEYCGGIGFGVRKNDAKINLNSGEFNGTFVTYFADGSIRGKFKMTPAEGSLNLSFSASSYAGKVKVTGGTGAWAGVKGNGTTKCDSPDSLHYSCVDHLKLS